MWVSLICLPIIIYPRCEDTRSGAVPPARKTMYLLVYLWILRCRWLLPTCMCDIQRPCSDLPCCRRLIINCRIIIIILVIEQHLVCVPAFVMFCAKKSFRNVESIILNVSLMSAYSYVLTVWWRRYCFVISLLKSARTLCTNGLLLQEWSTSCISHKKRIVNFLFKIFCRPRHQTKSIKAQNTFIS